MAELQTKRYPIRGALWGLLLGLSIAYFLFFEFSVFGFDSVGGVVTKMVIIVVIAMAVGVLWAYIAPPRKPSVAATGYRTESPPPAPGDEEPPPAPESESPPPAPEDEEPPAAPTE